ncbi:hypothetical protein THRCLA_07214 [Thraustotheca clavata]|uniref:Uncharacterized protein n=1 Tax=Thraustotheca clavata TaxID=74557 RepID=A0A1V9ZF87_9STRA|nr:hypothetical protein THRCLA_07214 [Thraustotheca clavata]
MQRDGTLPKGHDGRRAYISAAARNLSTIAQKNEDLHSEFGYGCNVDEHIKYGKCLDGRCMQRMGWEVHKLYHGSQQLLKNDQSLHYACMTNNSFAVLHLLSLPHDINALDQHGQSALHIASRQGILSIVEHLLNEPNINLHLQDAFGNTCLHIAALANQFSIVQLLLRAGCRWDLTNNENKLAADVAGPDQRIYYTLKQFSTENDLADKLDVLQTNAATVRTRQQTATRDLKTRALLVRSQRLRQHTAS